MKFVATFNLTNNFGKPSEGLGKPCGCLYLGFDADLLKICYEHLMKPQDEELVCSV